jgi:methylmalonyl-CoA mutase N-terminal domain/subunit
VVRVALQAMAAVLGGCQSLHTNSYDEALALPSEESAQLALRTQQILAHETGVPDTVDPVGGSYAIESLTKELEEKIWAKLREIREKGGMLKLIEKGTPQAEIQDRAYQYQQEIEAGKRKIVGVNCLQIEEKGRSAKRGLAVSPKLETEQVKRLKKFRASRSATAVGKTLQALTAASVSKENLFPYILNSIESGATLGEICGTLRQQFGEYNAR